MTPAHDTFDDVQQLHCAAKPLRHDDGEVEGSFRVHAEVDRDEVWLISSGMIVLPEGFDRITRATSSLSANRGAKQLADDRRDEHRQHAPDGHSRRASEE